ncbi:Argonaute siRNA chaperone complex subunit Arb1-domain-containing protein [Hypoxylon fuscum]|nr:Argonaute siRNA chaperone complex subunit Arb1-domain-containing protein [Hypoxylon fuscum]
MADLPRDPPVESGEGSMSKVEDESTSGQNVTHQEKETTVGADGVASSPNHEKVKLSGDGNTANDVPSSEDEANAHAGEVPIATNEGTQQGTEPAAKKKKKRKKPKNKAKKGVTGFEEFYADAPMTPTESAQEKKELYNPSRPFAERIEECIQRYRARRRMDSERTNLFSKYLALGGIDASPRQFTGFAEDRDALEEADAEDIRKMTATDFVGGAGAKFYNPADPEHWFVDFESIVKGFLSRSIPDVFLYDEPINRKAADLVKNFLNYVLMHDVCPEYTNDILAARNICEIAPMELRLVVELYTGLPGKFNTAASSLFLDGKVTETTDNSEDTENMDNLVIFRVTVLFSVLVDDKIKKNLLEDDVGNIYVVNNKEEKTYEVVETIQPNRKHVQKVEERLQKEGMAGKGKPAGILKLKPSVIEYGYGNELRLDEFDHDSAKVEEYLLEDELLAKFEVGMKIRAVVCELNIGIHFIKEVKEIRASFDQFLPQMLMDGWKEPVPNERPPPSASNPNANPSVEEEAVEGDEEAV